MDFVKLGALTALRTLGLLKYAGPNLKDTYVASQHVDLRKARSTATPTQIAQYRANTQKMLDTLNTQHGHLHPYLPEEIWLKAPDKTFHTISRVKQTHGKYPTKFVHTTILDPDMTPRGTEFTRELVARAQELHDTAQQAAARAGVHTAIPNNRTYRVQNFRKSQKLSLNKAKRIADFAIPEHEARISPSLRLPTTTGSQSPIEQLGISKQRLRRALRMLQSYKRRNLKFAGWYPHAFTTGTDSPTS